MQIDFYNFLPTQKFPLLPEPLQDVPWMVTTLMRRLRRWTKTAIIPPICWKECLEVWREGPIFQLRTIGQHQRRNFRKHPQRTEHLRQLFRIYSEIERRPNVLWRRLRTQKRPWSKG